MYGSWKSESHRQCQVNLARKASEKNITGPWLSPANEVWGKVQFLHLSVCPQGCMMSLPVYVPSPMLLLGEVFVMGGSLLRGLCQEGVSVSGEGLCERGSLWKEGSLWKRDPTPVMTSLGSHWSGRYASYWNAFWFKNISTIPYASLS